MSLEENIAQKESQIKELRDERRYKLVEHRRGFVEIEKRNAQDKDFAVAVCAAIDQGYLNMLDCILRISK